MQEEDEKCLVRTYLNWGESHGMNIIGVIKCNGMK